MSGGVGLEEVESAGDSEVERCRSCFDGVVGTGGVGFLAMAVAAGTSLASFAFRFVPFVLTVGSSVVAAAGGADAPPAAPAPVADDVCDFPFDLPLFSFPVAEGSAFDPAAVPPLPAPTKKKSKRVS